MNRWMHALPFAASYILAAAILAATWVQGEWLYAPAAFGMLVLPALDLLLGKRTAALPVDTKPGDLWWYKAIMQAWVPLQFVLMISVLWVAPDLAAPELLTLAIALGLATGGIGIPYAHEMMHQRSKWDQLAAKLLLSSVSYGHFYTEHTRGHHVRVATPDDPATAPRGMNLWQFLPRSIIGGFRSAWELDKKRYGLINPTTQMFCITGAMYLGAYALVGPVGLLVMLIQSAMAILQLEAVNYIEHYGLRRRRRYPHETRYERVGPQHSWDANWMFSNYVLANLQRHSDHHVNPQRSYPMLQVRAEAPELPFNYSVMTVLAFIPPLWREIMHPRLDEWEKEYG